MFSQFKKQSVKLPARRDLVGIVAVLIVIQLLLAFTLNVRTGPQGQVMGTVQGFTFSQRDGPISKVVSIRIHNGDLITIVVSPNQLLRPAFSCSAASVLFWGAALVSSVMEAMIPKCPAILFAVKATNKIHLMHATPQSASH